MTLPTEVPDAAGRWSVPGHLQLFSRHKCLKHDDLVATVPSDGVGVLNDATGDFYQTAAEFMEGNCISPHYTLRYIDGPHKGKTLTQARLAGSTIPVWVS